MQLPKVTYCILRGCRIVMEYQNTMLCSGYSHELKPCEHIVNCDLCTGQVLTHMEMSDMYAVAELQTLSARETIRTGSL